MLTPLQFKEIYNNNKHRVSQSIWATCAYNHFLDEVTEKDTLTVQQWNNLVKVCSVIKAHSERFVMTSWHTPGTCGTTHCIAGWAVALEANGVDQVFFDDYEIVRNLTEKSDKFSVNETGAIEYVGTTTCALNFVAVSGAILLSEYIAPFFFWSFPGEDEKVEDVVMECLIDVVLEEAKKESSELLSEFNTHLEEVLTGVKV